MLLDVLVADATAMITPLPFFQFTGVATSLLAPELRPSQHAGAPFKANGTADSLE